MPNVGYVGKGTNNIVYGFSDKSDQDRITESIEENRLAYYVESDNDSYDGFEVVQVSKKQRKQRQKPDEVAMSDSDTRAKAPRSFTFFMLENKRLNPFTIRSELQEVLKREAISIVGGRGSITIKDVDDDEIAALYLIKDLGGCLVRAKPPAPSNPITRVVIVGVDPAIGIDTIIEHSGCLAAHRITKKEGGEIRETTAIILDYPKNSVPASVSLLFLRFKTRPYNRPPVRCFRCQQYGHVAKHCSGRARCARCQEEHDTRQCSSTNGQKETGSVGDGAVHNTGESGHMKPAPNTSCASCRGKDHHTGSRECPMKVRAVAINKSMAQGGLTYAQAARGWRKDGSIPQPPTTNTLASQMRTTTTEKEEPATESREVVVAESRKDRPSRKDSKVGSSVPSPTQPPANKRTCGGNPSLDNDSHNLLTKLIELVGLLITQNKSKICTCGTTPPGDQSEISGLGSAGSIDRLLTEIRANLNAGNIISNDDK